MQHVFIKLFVMLLNNRQAKFEPLLFSSLFMESVE